MLPGSGYKNRQTYFSLWVHLVWATKNREPLITAELKWPLYKQIKQISNQGGYHLDFVNGVEDHIHLLYSLKSTQTVSALVKHVKGNSWVWVREQHLSNNYFSWQDGYGALSVSPYEVPKIRNYIRNQEAHHAKQSFEEELNQWEEMVIVPND